MFATSTSSLIGPCIASFSGYDCAFSKPVSSLTEGTWWIGGATANVSLLNRLSTSSPDLVGLGPSVSHFTVYVSTFLGPL